MCGWTDSSRSKIELFWNYTTQICQRIPLCTLDTYLGDEGGFALIRRIGGEHDLVRAVHVPPGIEVPLEEPQKTRDLHKIDERVSDLLEVPQLWSVGILQNHKRRTDVVPRHKVHPKIKEIELAFTIRRNEPFHISMGHPGGDVLDHDRRPRIPPLGDPIQVDDVARGSRRGVSSVRVLIGVGDPGAQGREVRWGLDV